VKFRLADVEPPPDVFAAVMATGILSIAAANHHYRQISETMGFLASLGLVVLVALVIVTHRLARWDLKDPDVTLRLFTFVAACAVLDTRLASQPVLVQALGGMALVSWLVLIVLSTRYMSACAWSGLRDRAHGAWELASVGTSGLAIVAAKVARYTPEHWWLAVAVPVWLAALCIYGLMTWVVATLWIRPLIYFGLHRISHRPEMLHFAGVWWAFVFPLGMHSAASYTMAAEIGQRSLVTVSLVVFWDALAVWLIVVVAGLLRLARGR
jgi:tellurite resistance protein TehA-like permease